MRKTGERRRGRRSPARRAARGVRRGLALWGSPRTGEKRGERRGSKPEPPPEAVAAGLHALAEALGRRYPEVEFVVVEPGRRLPRGARVLPGAAPADREAVGDGRERRARGRRADDDAVDH
jgi:hypothetical protein